MSRIWAVYFSAAGTTKKIVTCIADALAGAAADKICDIILKGALT